MTTHRVRLAQEYGTDLSSRYRAVQLRESIVDASSRASGICEIDFAGVRTLSDSFADELFGVLVSELGEAWFREHVLVSNLPALIRTTILEVVADRLSPREVVG